MFSKDLWSCGTLLLRVSDKENTERYKAVAANSPQQIFKWKVDSPHPRSYKTTFVYCLVTVFNQPSVITTLSRYLGEQRSPNLSRLTTHSIYEAVKKLWEHKRSGIWENWFGRGPPPQTDKLLY